MPQEHSHVSFWSIISHYPKTACFAAFATVGIMRLLYEMRKDYQYRKRVKQHRRDRPPPKPQKIYTPVSETRCIWEGEPPKKMNKGLGRLRHVRSLDDMHGHSYRPGSKIDLDDISGSNQVKRKYRILAIDGGGVKGIFSLRILERLVAKFPSLIDDIDLIAGTSTGGLIAIMMAGGYSPSQGLEIYKHNIPIIFQTNIFRKMAPFMSTYANRHRWEVFSYYFGHLKLSDIGKHIVITAFRLDGGPEAMGHTTFFPSGSWRPALMSNLPIASGLVPPDSDLECRVAAMRTTSAPTYFPIFQGYVDGGLFANNPGLSAVGRAYAHFPQVTPENTVVLSLGTGHSLKELKEAESTTSLDWGLQQWAPKLLDLLMSANELANEVNLKLMLKTRYHRVDTELPEFVALDAVDKMDYLIELADKVDLSEAEDFILEHIVNDNPLDAK